MPVSVNSPIFLSLATILAVFLVVLWLWLLVATASDLLGRDDLSTAGRAFWLVLLLALPYLGTFAYIASESRGMAYRRSAPSEELRDTLRRLATSAADELVKLDRLKAQNDISQTEYLRLRSRLVE